MIFTMITRFVVGVFYTRVHPFVASLLERANVTLVDTQMSLFSFALCLAAAALLLNLIGVQSYPVLMCLGAAIGVARKPLLNVSHRAVHKFKLSV